MPSHIILQVNDDREDVVLQFCTHKGAPNAAQETTIFSPLNLSIPLGPNPNYSNPTNLNMSNWLSTFIVYEFLIPHDTSICIPIQITIIQNEQCLLAKHKDIVNFSWKPNERNLMEFNMYQQEAGCQFSTFSNLLLNIQTIIVILGSDVHILHQ